VVLELVEEDGPQEEEDAAADEGGAGLDLAQQHEEHDGVERDAEDVVDGAALRLGDVNALERAQTRPVDAHAHLEHLRVMGVISVIRVFRVIKGYEGYEGY